MNIKSLFKSSSLIQVIAFLIVTNEAWAHGDISNQNMKGLKVAITDGLISGNSPIVTNKQSAIKLGKALFWDMSVGSDGIACASCHFHAGADNRTHNQLNPGMLNISNPATASSFNINPLNEGGPNYSLKAGDFPLFRFADPASKYSNVLFSTDDVIGSAGAFMQTFQGVNESGSATDTCAPQVDPLFHINNLNTRQTTSRNTPTIINAAFNFRNFWDGRANNTFNGETAFGLRDTKAKVWLATSTKKAKQISIKLANASLASQAVAPPIDMMEMSCQGRTFRELGKKLSHRRALETQQVAIDDSVLGEIRDISGNGLNTTYEQLIKKAFNKNFWYAQGGYGSSNSGATYTQMEANFAFFFGLAIQLYESTLISDQAPVDEPPVHDDDITGTVFPQGFKEDEIRGLTVFNDHHCNLCHSGPTFSAAINPATYVKSGSTPSYYKLIDRTVLGEQASDFGVDNTLIDLGFSNTSVTPDDYDIGLGGKDPYGNPLSFVEQYLSTLKEPTKKMIDPIKILACEFDNSFIEDFMKGELIKDKLAVGACKSNNALAKVPSPTVAKAELERLDQGRLSVATRGAFKIPTLRNVELTGPYMHNGSMKSLEEVVEFYNRGGNVSNRRHSSTLVFEQGFTEQNKKDLVAFLKTLTDNRVRWEKAPFDHPSLKVSHNHLLQENELGTGLADDSYITIPAVGKNGRTPEQGPLMSFDSSLQP
jgi:cytochrome c peroxidase